MDEFNIILANETADGEQQEKINLEVVREDVVVAAGTSKVEEALKSTVNDLQEIVRKKTDVIESLEKQRALLDKEVAHLRQDREKAVIRYATVEKQVLDSRNHKEAAEKKSKELQREIEILSGKIKGAAADKTRICGILDDKCHELRNSQKEVEKLKIEHSNVESKLKWHQTKVKLDAEAREALDKRVEDLTAEINQLKFKEISRAKEEVEVERNMLAEKQMIEQNATLILLRHNNEEKSRKIEALEKKSQQLENELVHLRTGHSSLKIEHEKHAQDHANVIQQLSDAQCLLDKQMLKIAELQSNQNELEIARTQLSLERDLNRQLRRDIQLLTVQVDEQNIETEKWHENETKILTLNKELAETVVQLKNECSLSNSKTTAVTLENEMIRKDKSYYENIIADLRKQLDDEIKKRNSDCQLMAKHISDKTKVAESFQRKIEELSGELEAQQKKHTQTIKELTREMNLLKKKSERLVSEVAKKSPTPSTTSDSSMESQNSEYPTIPTEPSQKQLIDRIVRLQNEIVRQSEKIDFLENHQAQLVEELKRLRKTSKK